MQGGKHRAEAKHVSVSTPKIVSHSSLKTKRSKPRKKVTQGEPSFFKDSRRLAEEEKPLAVKSPFIFFCKYH